MPSKTTGWDELHVAEDPAGAWRTLRTRRGERAVDAAGRRGHSALIPLLLPVYKRSRIARDVPGRVQEHFQALIRTYPAGRKPFLQLPDSEPLLELGQEIREGRRCRPWQASQRGAARNVARGESVPVRWRDRQRVAATAPVRGQHGGIVSPRRQRLPGDRQPCCNALSESLERVRHLLETEDVARFESAAEQLDDIGSQFEHGQRFTDAMKVGLMLAKRDVNRLGRS